MAACWPRLLPATAADSIVLLSRARYLLLRSSGTVARVILLFVFKFVKITGGIAVNRQQFLRYNTVPMFQAYYRLYRLLSHNSSRASSTRVGLQYQSCRTVWRICGWQLKVSSGGIAVNGRCSPIVSRPTLTYMTPWSIGCNPFLWLHHVPGSSTVCVNPSPPHTSSPFCWVAMTLYRSQASFSAKPRCSPPPAKPFNERIQSMWGSWQPDCHGERWGAHSPRTVSVIVCCIHGLYGGRLYVIATSELDAETHL